MWRAFIHSFLVSTGDIVRSIFVTGSWNLVQPFFGNLENHTWLYSYTLAFWFWKWHVLLAFWSDNMFCCLLHSYVRHLEVTCSDITCFSEATNKGHMFSSFWSVYSQKPRAPGKNICLMLCFYRFSSFCFSSFFFFFFSQSFVSELHMGANMGTKQQVLPSYRQRSGPRWMEVCSSCPILADAFLHCQLFTRSHRC